MKTQAASAQSLGLLEAFTCPLSGAIMEDPVIVVGSYDGRSYERTMIAERFERGDFSDPGTGLEMADRRIITNTALRNLIRTALLPNLINSGGQQEQQSG